MNDKMKKLKIAILLVSSLSVAVVLLNSCKKSEPQVSGTPAEVEQTICPVMGNPINKQYFAEYKGRKVYFCCPECIGKFKAEPEKYIAKLPQLKQ